MITLHHLEYSQSFRILWLLEELGAPYELKVYERDAETRLAPADYKALSPIGTAPVITDENGLVLAESNAVIDYILDSHPESPLRPAPGEANRADYLFWFHAGVGSLMPMQFFNGLLTMMKDRSPALVRPVIGKATDTVREMLVAPRLKTLFDKLEIDLARNRWIAGDHLTAADISMCYSIASADAQGRLKDRPNCQRWMEQMRETPSFQRAMEKDGRETFVFSF